MRCLRDNPRHGHHTLAVVSVTESVLGLTRPHHGPRRLRHCGHHPDVSRHPHGGMGPGPLLHNKGERYNFFKSLLDNRIIRNICCQGEYYNADEVQAMVAAEMLEEKRKKKEEEAMFDDIGEIGKKKRKGPMIAE